MKSSLLTAFLFLFALSALSQEKSIDTLYYSFDGLLKEKEGLIATYKVVEQKDSLYFVTRYHYLTNTVIYNGSYSDKELTLREGHFVYYNDDEIRIKEENYSNNIENGVHLEYFPSGKLYFEENFKEGKFDGQVLAYYESGKLKRSDTFLDGKFVSGKCFSEDSVEIEHFVWFQEPQYTGGRSAMVNYLSKKVKVSNQAQRVVIRFVVTAFGEVEDVSVFESGGKEMDKAALKAVRNMPNWQPAIRDKTPIRYVYRLPISVAQ